MKKITDLKRIVLSGVLIAFCNLSYAAKLHFESSAMQTTLIELYTSQGCSSCPPAEAYLNEFKDNPALWKQFIPMALHVDYWDYIGWKDRFAHPGHTTRQQQYARFHGMSTIYTPGFFVNGKEWRRGFFTSSLPTTKIKPGKIKVTLNNKQVTVIFAAETSVNKPLQFTIALLGMGLATQIQAGERKGRHSRHEFVVLTKNASEPIQQQNHIYQWRTVLPQNKSIKAKKYAVVAWVTNADSPVPIQAVGGYLPE